MLPRIHYICDLAGPQAGSWTRTLDVVAAAVSAGVDGVQVRAKILGDRDLHAFTRAVIDTVRPLGAVVIVNDRLDVALAAGADGVHLGLDDLPVSAARRLTGRDFLVGGTCRSADDARRAMEGGADYVGVGPVYPSTTKRGLPEPVGLGTVRQVSDVLPAIAISGITAERVPEVMAAGAHGVAVVAAIGRAPDPAAAARAVVRAVHAAAGATTP